MSWLERLAEFFGIESTESQPAHQFAVFVRGHRVHVADSLQSAEDFVRDTFEFVDAAHAGKKGFGGYQNTTKNRRWIGYRSQVKIVELKR